MTKDALFDKSLANIATPAQVAVENKEQSLLTDTLFYAI